MKAIFVGGGAGCRDVLELFIQGQLDILDLEILAVVDIDPDAPGMVFARRQGWLTITDLEQALVLDGLELIIELTGSEDALDKIFFNMPPGVRVMDHVMARVFWDLEKLTQTIRQQLDEQTTLEARIAKDRAELQEILDNLPDSVMVIDKDRTILRVNRRFEEVSGKRRENVEGLACKEACIFAGCGNTCDGFPGPFQTVLHTTKPIKRDGPDGEVFEEEDKYYQMTVKPILDASGEVSRVVRTSREVTQQVRLKQETEEWARHFHQLVQAVHGIITIKDLDGRYTLVNPRVLEISGLKENELLGCTARELFEPQAARVIEENDQRALEGGGYYATEERVMVGGKERIFFSERFPLTDYRGNVVAICCLSRDDTVARQLQQDLVQTERLAAVGKLAAGVAHELNNPLTGILTFAEDLLLEAEPDNPMRPDYEVIVNETMRCRYIVRDLLDFSRQKISERQGTDINDVIRRSLTIIERQASFHNIGFRLELGEEIPEVLVDARQMQQAILNLVINACDAMDASGEITIRSSLEDEGRQVAVAVSDKGCGIPAELMDDLYQPFFSTKGDQGNGLGLATVLGVMEQHNGRVDVKSTVGQGSTFTLTLPVAGT
jgi:two-component system NtrC family sensor kinase